MSCENNEPPVLLASKHPAQPGLQRLLQQNRNCEHAVNVSASKAGNIRLSLRYTEADCPWCLRRLWLYWRARAKAVEGQAAGPTAAREMYLALLRARDEFREFMPTAAGETLTLVEAAIARARGET